MFLSPYRMMDQYKDAMAIKSSQFEIAASVPVIIDDNLDRALAQIKQSVGFYVGGMGAKSFNVHKDHVSRMGFEAEAIDQGALCDFGGGVSPLGEAGDYGRRFVRAEFVEGGEQLR
ncbi:MAG: hypothetical protein IID32_00975 [Planctomycetes bacterium]|nr:hypothetical protein [Planctomycetota bacterium]